MGSGWNCLIYFSLQISGQASLIPWFSAVCAAVIANRNHFFCLYQHNISSESKTKCRRLVIAAKVSDWKLSNLHMLVKQESITFQKLGSQDFLQIANSVLNIGKSAIPSLFNKGLSSTSEKAKLIIKTFS